MAPRRVLLVTEDPDLVDAVLHSFPAGAGTSPDSWLAVRATPGGPPSDLVLVGLDVAVRQPVPPEWRGVPVCLVAVAGADAHGDTVTGESWRAAVRWGAQQVAMLPDAADWLADRVGAALLGPGGRSLAVVSGGGGAGGSTLAAATAVVAAAEGWRVALVDADRFGGGLGLSLLEDPWQGPTWQELAAAPLDEGALATLPRAHGVSVLALDGRVDPGPGFEALVAATMPVLSRAFDLVVVDCPAAAVAGVVPRCDTVVLACRSEVRAAAAARTVGLAVCAAGRVPLLVVRSDRPTEFLADEVAEVLTWPLVGTCRSDAAVSRAANRGRLGSVVRRGELGSVASDLVTILLEARVAA